MKVFLNGEWIGIIPHSNPEGGRSNADRAVDALKLYRRQADISTEISIIRDIQNRELTLYTDAGRCCRPLFIVKDQKLAIKKSDVRKLQSDQKVRSKDKEAKRQKKNHKKTFFFLTSFSI